MPRHALILALAATLLPASVLIAQQPTITHAQLTTADASKGLAPQIDRVKHNSAPTWIGYRVPVAEGFHSGPNGDHTTYLEGSNTHENYSSDKERSFDHTTVLMRIAEGSIEKLRVDDPDRPLDAGGLAFVWLNEVSPEDSVHVLHDLAQSNSSEKVSDDAIFIISLHQSSATFPALVQLASVGSDNRLREKAAFWLANQHGRDGFLAIQKLAREDGDSAFREKLTFDLTLCHTPDALEELIRMAKSDESPQVRKQAQFWMAQVGGKKVASSLRENSEHDPSSEVRKQAVFALSQLPSEEATTQLIQVASTSKDDGVRKQAIFWLGQSHDPRALDYLTQLIRQ